MDYKTMLSKLSIIQLKQIIKQYMTAVKIVVSKKSKEELIEHILKHTEFKNNKITIKSHDDVNIETPTPKMKDKKKEPTPKPKKEEPKVEPKKEEPKPKKEEPKPKKEEPKPKKEEPKPKKEEPKAKPKKEKMVESKAPKVEQFVESKPPKRAEPVVKKTKEELKKEADELIIKMAERSANRIKELLKDFSADLRNKTKRKAVARAFDNASTATRAVLRKEKDLFERLQKISNDVKMDLEAKKSK